MPSSSLQKSTRVILNRWSKQGFYAYIRPVSSKLVDARSKHSQYWVVSVEFRTVPPGQWRDEGSNLDEVIERLDKIVPHNREVYRQKTAGWIAPQAAMEAEKKQIRKKKDGIVRRGGRTMPNVPPPTSQKQPPLPFSPDPGVPERYTKPKKKKKKHKIKRSVL